MSSNGPAPSGNVRTGLILVALLLAATLLSTLYSGLVPLFNNNIYHLPILRGDYDLPQFAQDAFVQSLRRFSSGFWLTFAGSSSFIEPKSLLLAAFFVSRFLMMAAVLHLARSFGYSGIPFSALFLLLVAVSPLARGYAPGGGGLNIDYFSHSEVANATLILSLSLAVRGRVGMSVFLASITFFLNAFMAVWLAPLWLAVSLIRLSTREESLAHLVKGTALGAVCGSVLILPVIRTILSPDQPGYKLDYSYSAYLRDFFPYHFFIDSLSGQDLALIAFLSANAVAAGLLLRKHRARFIAAALAAIALLALGSVVPFLTESRFILNLHLIRSAVLIQWLAVIGLSMAAAGLATEEARPAQAAGFGMAALLTIGKAALPSLLLAGVLVALFGKRLLPPVFRSRWVALLGLSAFAATLALSIPNAMLPTIAESRNLWTIPLTWERVGRWSAQNTPPASVFLLPVGTEKAPATAAPLAQNLAYDVTGFFAAADRSVWTNYKFGAAPMWAPSTHAQWRERYDAVLALATAEARLAYAREHGISHVVTFCDPALAEKPIHRDGDLCIYDASKKESP